MALTLSDLRTRLNVRTGDPNGDFLSTSERDMILNDAARKVASDLYRNGTALLTDRKKIQLEPAVTEYALPDDLIGVQEVFWEDNSTRYEVEQRPLQSFQDIDRSGDRPIYFDVFGQTGEFVARANVLTATVFDSSTYNDHTFQLANKYTSGGVADIGDLANIRTGDIVYNLSDDSQGTVTTIYENGSTPYITAQFQGGGRNVTFMGDDLVFERSQKSLPILHVYPDPTDNASVEVVQSGTVDADLGVSEAVTTVSVLIDIDISTTDVSAFQLYGIRLSGGVLRTDKEYEYVEIKQGSTTKGRRYYRRLDTSALVIRPDQEVYFNAEGTWSAIFYTGNTASVDYEILKLKAREGLTAYYARYPNRMADVSDQLELPEIALEALLLHAEYEVHLKAEGGRNNMSSQAYALYEMELQKIQKFQRTRNIRGSRTVRNVMYG